MYLLYHVRRKGNTRKSIYFPSRGLSGIICHERDSKPINRLELHVMQLLYHTKNTLNIAVFYFTVFSLFLNIDIPSVSHYNKFCIKQFFL